MKKAKDRTQEIIDMRLNGFSYRVIGEKVGLRRRQVRLIWLLSHLTPTEKEAYKKDLHILRNQEYMLLNQIAQRKLLR